MEYIREQLIDIIKGYTKEQIEEISDNTILKNDLGIDSISLVQILIEIEERYDIEFEAENIIKMREFGLLYSYVVSKLK